MKGANLRSFMRSHNQVWWSRADLFRRKISFFYRLAVRGWRRSIFLFENGWRNFRRGRALATSMAWRHLIKGYFCAFLGWDWTLIHEAHAVSKWINWFLACCGGGMKACSRRSSRDGKEFRVRSSLNVCEILLGLLCTGGFRAIDRDFILLPVPVCFIRPLFSQCPLISRRFVKLSDLRGGEISYLALILFCRYPLGVERCGVRCSITSSSSWLEVFLMLESQLKVDQSCD